MTEDEWSAETGDDIRNWKYPVVPGFSDRKFRLFWDQALPFLSHRLYFDSRGLSEWTSKIFQSFERGKIRREDCWNALVDSIVNANDRYLSRLCVDGDFIEILEAHRLHHGNGTEGPTKKGLRAVPRLTRVLLSRESHSL